MTLGEVLAGKRAGKGKVSTAVSGTQRTQKTLRHLYVEEDNREEKEGEALWSLNNSFVQGTERILHGGP